MAERLPHPLRRALRRLLLALWLPALGSGLGLGLGLGLVATSLQAKEAASVAADPALEKRVMAISAELRCLVCQNQTIADSHADLAVDLRNQIADMLAKGQSDDQVLQYMTERYGDFVLYKPPLKATTALLWLGPAVLLVGALMALFIVLRRRQQLSPDAFDPESPDDEDTARSDAPPARSGR